MRLPLPLLALPALLALAAPAPGQNPFDDPPANVKPLRSFAAGADVTAEVDPPKARRGEAVKYRITVAPKDGAWTYPVRPADPGQATRTVLTSPNAPTPPGGPPPAPGGPRPPGDLIFVAPVADPPGAKWKTKAEKLLSGVVQIQYSPAPVTWEVTAVVSPKATPGKKRVELGDGTQLQVCNAGGCVPSKRSHLPVADFEVLDGDPVPVSAAFAGAVEKALDPPPAVAPAATPAAAAPPPMPPGAHPLKAAKSPAALEREYADLLARLDVTSVAPPPAAGVWAFVLTAVAWGLVSLVTPCVFPMIPITVSIFLKQAHQSTAETIKLAAVYCLTIVVVLGLSAVALLKVFVDLSVSPGMNLFLGGLFVFFALSLFGMYDITLPNFMLRFTQKKQGAGGVVGTVFGALAFTIVGFTCVAPFLGGFAGMAASGNYTNFELVLGGLAFSTAFASPFFVLALFPRLLKALPRSGGWLDNVKAAMGFLELAAALKFLRTAELRVLSPPQYFTYDLVLGAWVAIALACGLYLLGVYRLPHDDEKPNIGVPRLVFALLFLGLGVYLLPATFKTGDGKGQRPGGAVFAWVDAFLLPEPGQETFTTDLPGAVAAAAKGGKAGKPLFLDFTGVTCTNCVINEANVFPLPAVREAFKGVDVVRLYTDEVPAALYAVDPGDGVRKAEGLANRAFKNDAFKTDQLPLYAVVQPRADGTVAVLGVYDEGKINDPARFAAFLKDAAEKAKR